ncbi:MAG TPA: hypothetical protein VG323_09155 [Thermoanaerobaculia bacterium]|nr:hypothetical protein [Thermoanaerobaculia bacterium]
MRNLSCPFLLLLLLSTPLAAETIDLKPMAPLTLAAVAPDAASAPPPTLGFFAGGSNGNTYPPDPSGAVGPRHVVSAFNNGVVVDDRGGNGLTGIPITQFWHDVGLPDLAYYRPRVLYDAGNDRWIIAMLGDDGTYANGALLLAISATGDPTGTWRRYRTAFGTDVRLNADATRMVMTADQIVITVNEWLGQTIENGVDAFEIRKADLYGTTAPPATKVHETIAIDWIPVAAPDTTVRMVTTGGGFFETFQLDATGKQVGFQSYVSPAGLGYTQWTCSQLGLPNSVDCGLGEPTQALLRDGSLWVVGRANSGTRSVIVVWKIAGTSAATTVISDPVTDYSYPSIAVNHYGTALIGYSALNINIFPSAEYRTVDSSLNVSAPATVKNGEDQYTGFYWGTYSTTLVDPTDDSSFWTLQSYGTKPVNLKSTTWGTWWTYIRVPRPHGRAVRH